VIIRLPNSLDLIQDAGVNRGVAQSQLALDVSKRHGLHSTRAKICGTGDDALLPFQLRKVALQDFAHNIALASSGGFGESFDTLAQIVGKPH